jgi:hypothetical protein
MLENTPPPPIGAGGTGVICGGKIRKGKGGKKGKCERKKERLKIIVELKIKYENKSKNRERRQFFFLGGGEGEYSGFGLYNHWLYIQYFTSSRTDLQCPSPDTV